MSRNGISGPEQRMPLFLADEAEEQGIGDALSRSAISSRILKAIAWAAVPGALAIAVLSMEAPEKLFSDITASVSDTAGRLLDHSPQAGAIKATPVIRYATADAQALPPVTGEAPARDEPAIVPEPDQRRAERNEPPSEALLSQFQAWAADKSAQPPAEPAPVVQDTPVAQDTPPIPAAQEAPAPVLSIARDEPRDPPRSMQKRRQGKALHNAHAELRPAHLRRKRIAQEQYSRVPDRPAQEVRAPEPVQPPSAPVFQTAPSFFQTLGFGTQQ
jgi:hypothetical protein